ncbi:hypothetical protein RJT34_22784 [Clitoria ternatea]|uniref:Pectinesterase inhibitor domain-containing protein n=1 Tax=Clitoria ternatea TaxID=43366 RepID=A0AAN9FJP7_CLITE
MEINTKYLWVLATCLVLFLQETSGAEKLKGMDLVAKTCKATEDEKLCLEALSSDKLGSATAEDLQDLAMIALKYAASNASGILQDAKRMIDDPDLDPAIQQGLSDCKDTLLDAESQIEDTIAALLTDSKSDAKRWLKIALAAIDTCDDSIPGEDDVLSKKSRTFRRLCTICLSISKAMLKDNN